MPSVKLDKKTVLDLLGKKVDDKVLEERLPLLGTDLDSVSEDEIDIEIFPNRPDMLSEQGLARAFSTFMGYTKGLKKYSAKKDPKLKMIIDDSVKDVRPFTACAVVKGLKFNDEKIKQVIQIQEKLHVTFGRRRKKAAIGIYPMEAIKMPITFKADKPENIKFRPLEARGEMTGKEILLDHPTGKEYAHLLEGLKKYPFFEDANGEILSMPPVINSEKTGRIDENTTDVFIECSGFDKKVLSKCLNFIVTALADMGGEIYSMDVDNKAEGTKYILPELEPEEMDVRLEYVNKLLGLELNEKDLKENLEKMGFGYKSDKKTGKALIPCYRADIIHEIDLIEDIAIAYGYDNFEPVIPKVATIGQESELEKFKQKLREVLIGFGHYETKSYNITSSKDQTEMMRAPEIPIVKLANSLTVDFDCLRYWMIPSMMGVLRENKRHEYPQSYFDFGEIFKKAKDTKEFETGIAENCRLGLVICNKDADFTSAKQMLDAIFNALGEKYEIKPTDHESFVPGRVARVSYSGKDLAYVGEIHPEVLNNFDIEMPVAALELNITELFELTRGNF